MSLFHPPEGFPPQLAFLWPLVWVQVLMLRAQMRAAYGRGVKYHWCIGANGRVYLHSIDWIPGQKKERATLQPSQYSCARLAAACDGRAAVPAYTRLVPRLAPACFLPAPRLGVPAPVAGTFLLPLPET